MTVSLRDDLVTRLLDHCRLVCETGEEGPIADAVEARYRDLGAPVVRVGHSVVVGAPTGERPLVLLVGHLDVVAPTPADRVARVEHREDGEVVVGRGTSDMKSGNVIGMRVFEDHATRPDRRVDLALVLYAGEEGAAEGNELAAVLDAVPWLREAALAIVLEPTDLQVELGCMGSLHATITVRGKQSHSARPWDGDNALTKAGALLTAFRDLAPVPVEVDGIGYRDVWSLTQMWTENGRNVIPGSAHLNLNFRFSPSRDIRTAEAEVRALIERLAADTVGEVEIEVVDRAIAAPPRASDDAVATFVAAAGVPVAGKQAWTDVARFAAIGVPALNFGPGRTDQAHQEGEFIAVDALVAGHAAVERYVVG